MFFEEQHSRVELPTQLWKSCVLPLHQCCLKIKNMNFQPFRKDKGPHPIYLFRFDATSVNGEPATVPFSVYKHLSNFHPSRLSLFMTLSQNAKFNHPKTEIFGSTCANSTEAFFEAHQIFARPMLSITSIALYWAASFLFYRFGSVLHCRAVKLSDAARAVLSSNYER